jgi:serine/threonine protein kinase
MALDRQRNICPNCFYSPYRGGICPRCKYTATESDAAVLPYGVVLSGRYILGRLLGVGGFGVTYLTLDIGDNGVRAIKEYFPTTMAVRDAEGRMKYNGKSDKRVFDYGYHSFKKEAEYLKLFKGERLIVQVSDSFDANGTTYLVMEYLNGVNLKALLRGLGNKMPVAYAIEILVSMTEALKKIHAKGLIHRDISPENIFVTKDGEKKIIDFGATKEIKGARDIAILLKPGFAPPEQYTNNGEQGPWTDIYALASTFYFVASGVKIPDAKERAAGVPMASLESLVPEIGIDLSLVIDKALALDPHKRYRSADEFYRALPIRGTGPAAHASGAGMTGYVGRLSGVPYIMIERGRGEGEKWPIPQNIDIRIGRQPGVNNVVIFDHSISREHGVIRYDSDSGNFVLRDVSTNGTFTDKGVRYKQNVAVPLSPGNRFFLAKDNIMMKVGLG